MNSRNHKTKGGSHEQHVKAGKAGGEAHHTCRGRECSHESKSEHGSHGGSHAHHAKHGGSHAEHAKHGGSHAEHVKAGRAGGLAPHTCRGRECSEK